MSECQQQLEEGEIVDDDDLEQISDSPIDEDYSCCSTAPVLGKSLSHKERLRGLSLSSISDTATTPLAPADSKGPSKGHKVVRRCKRKRRLCTSSKPRKRIAVSTSKRSSKHVEPTPRADDSSDSDSYLEIPKDLKGKLKEAVHISGLGEHKKHDSKMKSSLQDRLKLMTNLVKDNMANEQPHSPKTDSASDSAIGRIQTEISCVSVDVSVENNRCEKQIDEIEKTEPPEEVSFDKELENLRLEALKTAILNKKEKRKKQRTTKQQADNKENAESAETLIAVAPSDGDDPVKKIGEDSETVNNSAVSDSNDSVKKPCLEQNTDNKAPVMSNDPVEDLEDEDILRAGLLAALSKKMTETAPAKQPLLPTPNPPQNIMMSKKMTDIAPIKQPLLPTPPYPPQNKMMINNMRPQMTNNFTKKIVTRTATKLVNKVTPARMVPKIAPVKMPMNKVAATFKLSRNKLRLRKIVPKISQLGAIPKQKNRTVLKAASSAVIVKPLIISLNSESDSDHHDDDNNKQSKLPDSVNTDSNNTNTNNTIPNKILKDDTSFLDTVDKFLKEQRTKVELQKQKSSMLLAARRSSNIGDVLEKSAVKLLPKSQQIEYRALLRKIKQAEMMNPKRIGAMNSTKNIINSNNVLLRPTNNTIPQMPTNNDIVQRPTNSNVPQRPTIFLNPKKQPPAVLPIARGEGGISQIMLQLATTAPPPPPPLPPPMPKLPAPAPPLPPQTVIASKGLQSAPNENSSKKSEADVPRVQVNCKESEGVGTTGRVAEPSGDCQSKKQETAISTKSSPSEDCDEFSRSNKSDKPKSALLEEVKTLKLTLTDIRTQRNKSLQMKGKYEEALQPIIKKIYEASKERKTYDNRIKMLLNELATLQSSLSKSHDKFSSLVRELVDKKKEIDESSENVKGSNVQQPKTTQYTVNKISANPQQHQQQQQQNGIHAHATSTPLKVVALTQRQHQRHLSLNESTIVSHNASDNSTSSVTFENNHPTDKNIDCEDMDICNTSESDNEMTNDNEGEQDGGGDDEADDDYYNLDDIDIMDPNDIDQIYVRRKVLTPLDDPQSEPEAAAPAPSGVVKSVVPEYVSPLPRSDHRFKNVDPYAIMCPYEVNGSCRDEECGFKHYLQFEL